VVQSESNQISASANAEENGVASSHIILFAEMIEHSACEDWKNETAS
jgi:hypothetical protein